MAKTRHISSESFANAAYDASHGHLSAAATDRGGLATGPRDTVSGMIEDTPAEPLERPGTENAEEAEKTDRASAIDGPRLTPQGHGSGEASGEDETDPMGGVKMGQGDKAEG